MTSERKQVVDAALALSADERADLAERLIRSLDQTQQADLEAAWRVEIERRLDDIDRGNVELIPVDEAMRRLRDRTKR